MGAGTGTWTARHARKGRIVKKIGIGTRLVLIALAALLTAPVAEDASPVGAKPRSRTITRAFSNPTAIHVDGAPTFPSPVSATLYPSPIVVSGLKGTIRDVNLTLDRLGHANAEEMQVLLVGPRGQTAIVLAYVGGGFDASDVTLRLDDEAATPLPDDEALQSGAFRPLNGDGGQIVFNAPAPSASANVALSAFDGTNPNGTWRLFVQDDYGPTGAGIIEGWELELKVKLKAKKRKR
jgi:subtilisin-like proprotein convertase family protein